MRQVSKRRVFYLGGFDPRGMAAYYRMFCEESEKQSARSGILVKVERSQSYGPLTSVWSAEISDNDGSVKTTIEFFKWDDIVRRHWPSGLVRMYWLAIKTCWHGIVTTGLLARVFRIAKWQFVTGVVPVLILFGLPLLALLAGGLGYSWGQSVASTTGWILPLLCASSGFVIVLAFGYWLGRKLRLGWLLRTYAFVVEYGRGRVPELDSRLGRLAEHIARYIETSDDDEILIVGHSVGANLAASVLARSLAANPQLCRSCKSLNLLTLGGSIPMQGLLPEACDFRDELSLLAKNSNILWVDVSATEDAICFPLLNPVIASGVVLDRQVSGPKVVSASFREMLAPETYSKVSWDLFRMHFQYLMASERECTLDYLSITTGSLAFRQRFG